MNNARPSHRIFMITVTLACAVLSSAGSVSAYEARVAWSSVGGATGYKVYVRQNLDPYGAGMDVGAPAPDADGAVRSLLTALSIDATNYVAVTSYDGSGESARSNELSMDYATVARLVDSDGDGLSDAQEDVNLNRVVDAGETDPRRADSDGDGLSDGAEVQTYRTNPLRADTDGDGFSDGIEIAAGTDPNDPLSYPPGPPPPPPLPTHSATATPTPQPTSTPSRTATATLRPTATVTASPVDMCANPMLVPVQGGVFTGTTSGSSSQSGTCATSNNSPEQVFQWTPAISGKAMISTCGSGTKFDTVVYMRNGNCRSGAQVACNDDTAGCGTGEPNDHHGSTIAPVVTAGQIYFIVVDGYNGRSGTFNLTVTAPVPATPTAARTAGPTDVPTQTAAASGTTTAAPTVTPALTAIRTVTPTATKTATPTTAPTRTATPTPTLTPTVAATPTETPASGDLILNGGFEAGQVSWSGWKDAQNASEAVVTAVGSCAGTQSLHMFDAASRTRAVYQEVAVGPGAALRLTLVAGAKNLGTNQGCPILEWRNGTTVLATSDLTLPPGTYGCTSFVLDATAPAGTTQVRLRLTLGPVTTGVPRNDGEVWYDEVTLVPSTPGPTPISTPSAAGTPTDTSSQTATATPTTASTTSGQAPASTATATNPAPVGPTGTLVPDPTPAATPQGTCGNGQVESGEQCDGTDDAACPGLCMPDCSCPLYLELPLDGWSLAKGTGIWGVQAEDREAKAPVLVTETTQAPSTGFGIAYPSSPALGASLPLLAFTIRDSDYFTVEVVVSAVGGPARVLAYEAADGPVTLQKNRAAFRVGSAVSGGQFVTTYRDLAADLRRAFGATLARVQQVQLNGGLSASSIMLADRLPASGSILGTPESVRLPLAGWARHGTGSVFTNEYDPVLDGPTLRTDAAGAAPSKLQLDYPAVTSVQLIAPYETLSLLVRDENKFAVELKVRTSDGKLGRLRYEAGLSAPKLKRRRVTLPLVFASLQGSPYRLVTVDLGADATLLASGVTLDQVLAVKLQGEFQIGDMVLSGPIQ
jgi:hypothetical protein